MGGQSSQTQNQQQTTNQDYLGSAHPLVQGILGQLQSGLGQTNLTPEEQQALSQLTQQAQGGNPYAPAIGSYAQSLLGGGGAQQFAPAIQGAIGSYQQALQPFASGSMVGQNPALQAQLDQIRTDVTNQVNPAFAAAGRDLSPANAMALGRGVAQGQAPVIAGQYNTDIQNQLGAINSLYQGNLQGTGILSGINQTALGNQGTGVGAASEALGAGQWSPQQLLNIAQTQRGIPQQQLNFLASLGLPIAGLGGTGTQQGTITSTKQLSPVEEAQGWTKALANIGSIFGGGGGGGATPAQNFGSYFPRFGG